MDNENLQNKVQYFLFSRQCRKTYFHSIEVGDYAYQVGQKYLTNPEKVRVAGYLHDISAIYRNDQRLQAAREFHIEINGAEREFPIIIHQKLSRYIAQYYFNVVDNEILSAIECHTTLKKNYSTMDLVLFVADKVKWDQKGEPPYLPGLLAAMNDSLEQAAYYYIDYILNHDIKVIHPWLREAYEQLKWLE